MLCCCVSLPEYQDKPLIVDLNDVLKEKAWKNFQGQMSFCQKLVAKREKFDIEVPENFFVFEERSQTITRSKRANFKIEGDEAETSNADVKNTRNAKGGNNDQGTRDTDGLLKGKIPSRRDMTSPEVVSLDTEFSNATSERQMYKFRFEKTRTTVINVSFQKGFTVGGRAKFSLGIPIAGGEVETEMQLQVTKSEGQTFEESMVMEATSDIAVGPNSCYTANVQLEERPLHATFTVVTRMSMPQGRAPVYIKKKSDGEKVFVYYVKNLTDTFASGAVPCAQAVKGEDGKPVVDKVDFVVDGVLKGMLACNHKIALTSDETEETKRLAKQKYLLQVGQGKFNHEHEDED